jgi:predicted DCC family thiol-disulfide oxidoreductase YuxK
MRRIILFDGVCNFCDSSVQFIIKRDLNGAFQFAPLQGETGKKLLNELDLKENLDSIVYIEDDRYYKRSAAALKVCENLGGVWRLFVIFKIIPTPIRDIFYDIVAKNRYKWFGKKESCMIPSPEIRSRFLE